MNKKILIVDDEPSIVRLLSSRLEMNGYEVFVAYDGLECIQIAQRENPDLILLDISMPHDGVRTFEQLKGIEITKLIPVIFLSALGSTETKIEVLKMGAIGFFEKPFDSVELIKNIKELLD